MADTKNGTNFIVYVNTGTPTVPTYEKVGCQRDATIDESSDTIDISCKDSRAQRVLPGRYSSTLSFDHLYIEDDAGYLALQDANRDGTLILVAKQLDSVITETAEAKVDSISEAFPDQAESVVSVSMTLDGFWDEAGT